VVPGEYFFGFYKTRHILLSESANCTVLRAVVLTQYRRVTDRRTDGIAVASTALAMRHAVKTEACFTGQMLFLLPKQQQVSNGVTGSQCNVLELIAWRAAAFSTACRCQMTAWNKVPRCSTELNAAVTSGADSYE